VTGKERYAGVVAIVRVEFRGSPAMRRTKIPVPLFHRG
jgi:hypothetical protein